jgi:hypothetical protein
MLGSAETISRMEQKGEIIRLARGLYSLSTPERATRYKPFARRSGQAGAQKGHLVSRAF